MNNIPTYFKGIKMKSRFEAQTAFVLDTFGIEWKYEPYSLLLPDGTFYMPDFYAPGLNLFVECRGYENEKGERQIESFSKLVVSNEVLPLLGAKDFDHCDYLVIKSDSIQFFEENERWGLGHYAQPEVMICKCGKCGKYFIVGTEGSYECRSCGWWRGNDHLAIVVNMKVCGGQLILNGRDISKYERGPYSLWRKTINQWLTRQSTI